jgi:hypothetical protein
MSATGWIFLFRFLDDLVTLVKSLCRSMLALFSALRAKPSSAWPSFHSREVADAPSLTAIIPRH